MLVGMLVRRRIRVVLSLLVLLQLLFLLFVGFLLGRRRQRVVIAEIDSGALELFSCSRAEAEVLLRHGAEVNALEHNLHGVDVGERRSLEDPGLDLGELLRHLLRVLQDNDGQFQLQTREQGRPTGLREHDHKAIRVIYDKKIVKEFQRFPKGRK